jgi:glucoamylase
MVRCASPGGLLPEQVWDAPPIADLGLEPGRPSGSAMPLIWAHAEFLKLLVARERGRPIEWLERVAQHFHATTKRRAGGSSAASHTLQGTRHWRLEVPVRHLPPGKALAIEDREPFLLHLGFDRWQRTEDRAAEPTAFGLWSVLLSNQELAGATELNFTRRYDSGWEHCDHRVAIDGDGGPRSLPKTD